jgi:3-oxoacyl-[acyl-carrier protein] reductase
MEGALEGRVALVTGASRGIGRAIGLRLAKAGARLIVNYERNESAAQDTVRRVREGGGEAEAIPFDVSDIDAVTRAFGEVVSKHGRLDILVNNAGATADNLVLRVKPEEWDRIVAVNLRGTFACTRAALRSMLRARYGRIINIASVVGLMGNAGQAAYAAAKAGVIGFTKSTAREVASRGITVNALAPGLIETEMSGHLPDGRVSEYLKLIPVGRLGTAEEVAELAAFLTGPAAGYITGQVIGINGGLYM